MGRALEERAKLRASADMVAMQVCVSVCVCMCALDACALTCACARVLPSYSAEEAREVVLPRSSAHVPAGAPHLKFLNSCAHETHVPDPRTRATQELVPTRARLVVWEGKHREVAAESVQPGDILAVLPGACGLPVCCPACVCAWCWMAPLGPELAVFSARCVGSKLDALLPRGCCAAMSMGGGGQLGPLLPVVRIIPATRACAAAPVEDTPSLPGALWAQATAC